MSGGQGTVRLGGFPTCLRPRDEEGSTKLLSYADGSAALAAALTSNQVTFDTTRVRNANGGQAGEALRAVHLAKQGSSYSHLDEATYRAGNRDSLHEPPAARRGGDGPLGRPITKAVLKAVGW